MNTKVRLALLLLVLGGSSAQVGAQVESRNAYPVWIATPTGALDETLTLQNPSYVTLFTLRPKEGYALDEAVKDKKGKEWLPVGSHLIHVPGSALMACQAIRPKGNERFTCLRDDDADGDFDGLFRPGAGTNIFIAPLQLFGVTFAPLSAPARYHAMDERDGFRPSEFIMQYSVQGKLNIVSFCFEPYRRKASWGVPHLVDDCLVLNMTHKRDTRQYPYSVNVHGNRVTILSFDAETKAMTFRIRRTAAEHPITFGY